MLRFDDQLHLVMEEKKEARQQESNTAPPVIPCPLCQKGTIIKGKTAFGCSAYKEGCGFRYSFETLREKANQRPLTKELVISILKEGVGV